MKRYRRAIKLPPDLIRVKLTPAQINIIEDSDAPGFNVEGDPEWTALLDQGVYRATFWALHEDVWDAILWQLTNDKETLIDVAVERAMGNTLTDRNLDRIEDFVEKQTRKMIASLIKKIKAALSPAPKKQPPAERQPKPFVEEPSIPVPPEPIADPSSEHPDRILVGEYPSGTVWYVYNNDWAIARRQHEMLLKHWERKLR